MKDTFEAFVLRETDASVRGALETFAAADLDDADTVIQVQWSSINYKDALAGTGKGAIARRLPLIGGIDLAGTVVESNTFTAGTPVVVCGGGLSETLHGGYAEYARVPGDLAVALPEGLGARDAMVIGTAGMTAALALARFEQLGLSPDQGPVIVTGATGGVGSFAIDLLAGAGYEVIAVTGSPQTAADYLTSLGAKTIVDRRAIETDRKPLHRAEYAGVVDNAGGDLLAHLLKAVLPRGVVAAIGLAGGASLPTTVLPFILRGVTLTGINSVELTPAERADVWQRLATGNRPAHLSAIATQETDLAGLSDALAATLEASVPGRTVVRVGASGAPAGPGASDAPGV